MARQPVFDRIEASSLAPDPRELSGAVEADGAPVLTEAQRNALQRRLDEHDQHPDDAVEWDDLRRELLEQVARRRASGS
jgi:putative addiction module component (TIGR02574 family)